MERPNEGLGGADDSGSHAPVELLVRYPRAMQGQADPLDEILHAAEPPLVLCPLGFERRAFLRFGKLPVVTTGPGADAITRAFAERDRWPVRQPRLIILLGLAGALNEKYAAGTAHAVEVVRSRFGDAPMFAPVLAPMLDQRTPPMRDPECSIVESAQIVVDAREKSQLRARTGADLVDTESRTFARCADAAGIPWAIVRGVSDDAFCALPAEFATFVDAAGETRATKVIAALLQRPTLIRTLMRIGRDSRTAMRDASFTADALGCLQPIDLCSARHPLVLFGGSFDPPHARHATMLADAMRVMQSPCAIAMPAALNPLKCATPPAPPDARLALCRANFNASVADFPAELRLSSLELARPGPSYTIDTLESLVARQPKLRGAIRLLVGSDAIRGIEHWHRWREVLALARPAVVVRPPDTVGQTVDFLADFAARHGFADADSWLLPIAPLDLSSTSARAAILRGERPTGLADGVWREITKRGLYGFSGAR